MHYFSFHIFNFLQVNIAFRNYNKTKNINYLSQSRGALTVQCTCGLFNLSECRPSVLHKYFNLCLELKRSWEENNFQIGGGGGGRKSIASKWLIRGRGESFNRESNSLKQMGVRESKASSEKVVIYKNRQNCLQTISKLPPPPRQALMYYNLLVLSGWNVLSVEAGGLSSATDTQKTRVPPAATGSWPTAAMYVPIAEGHRTLHVGSLAALGVLIAATGRGRGPLTRHFPALPALDHTGPLFSDTQGSNNKQLFALDFQAHKLSDSCRVSGFGTNLSTFMPKRVSKL